MRRLHSRAARRAVLSLGCALSVASARADLLTVCDAGCDSTTIQGAVNAASPGDTIQVQSLQPHVEANILVLTPVTIEGVPGVGTVVEAAAAPGSLAGTIFAVGTDTTVVLRDLTLRYGSVAGDGGGVFNLGNLTLERVTVASCGAEGVGNVGGGIYNLGSLVLRSSSVRDSTADDGGNIYNAVGATLTATDSALVSGDASSHGGNLHNRGSATLIRCRVYGGTAFAGGGIYNDGGSTLFTGTLEANQAGAGGGGIYMQSGSLEVANSLLHLNVTVFATGQGGGALIAGGSAVFHDTTFYANGSPSGGAVFQDSSTAVRLENCTLSYNSASGSGGGLYVTGTRRAKIRSSTVVSNVADVEGDGAGDGGGIFLEPCSGTCPTDRVFLANSIVAGNLDGSPGGPFAHDCSGLLTSEGYDLVQDASTGTIGTCRVDGDTGGVLVQVAPLLSDLGDNGGPPTILGGDAPFTHAELPGSPTIDGGDPAGCTDATAAPLAHDERGAARVGRCDLGAYEADGLPRLFADGFESGDTRFW